VPSCLSGYIFTAIQKQSAPLIAGLKVIIEKRMNIDYSRFSNRYKIEYLGPPPPLGAGPDDVFIWILDLTCLAVQAI
jgi:hypothetical protein